MTTTKAAAPWVASRQWRHRAARAQCSGGYSAERTGRRIALQASPLLRPQSSSLLAARALARQQRCRVIREPQEAPRAAASAAAAARPSAAAERQLAA